MGMRTKPQQCIYALTKRGCKSQTHKNKTADQSAFLARPDNRRPDRPSATIAGNMMGRGDTNVRLTGGKNREGVKQVCNHNLK